LAHRCRNRGRPPHHRNSQVDSELARQRKGTGIGLTLVKSLVELHGGALRMIGEKGSGTTATLILPWHSPAS